MDDPHAPRPWRLSLVIPAYNEEAGIRQAIAEADAALADVTSEHEILVVDDGSNDGTAAAVLDEARHRPAVRLLRHGANRGYGAALRTGFEAARFDRVAFTDADCQFDLADLASLLPLADACPLAVGFRAERQDSRLRCFVSWGYNTAVRALLGTRVRDCDCALKVFRREALARLMPESSNFFVNTEMLARARQLGYRVAEAGVRHRPRARGASKVSPRDVPRVLRALLPFWWSRVLFAGETDCGSRTVGAVPCRRPPGRREWRRGPAGAGVGMALPPNRTHSPGAWIAALAGRARLNRAALALLFAVAVLLFFARIGTPLQEPQETRFAEVPRQMLAGHTALVPALPTEPFADKPPLLPWLVMLSYRLFGVHDWAARLVAGGVGVAVVLLTYLWGRRAFGPRAALAGALVLCLSARFVYLGRLLTTDGLLAACVVAAWAAAHAAVRGPELRRGWWLLSALACGLGLLTKGPVALVLVGVPVVAFTRLDPRAARPSWRMGALYVAAAVGLAAPWFVAQEAAQPGFLVDFLWRQHVVRFSTPFNHEEPPWFFLPGLLLGMLPWTLLLPGFVRFLFRRSARAAARRPAGLGFVLLAFAWSLLFFSASGCKRATYILPALPPLALALGAYVDAVLARGLAARAGSALARRGAALAYRATQLVFAAGIVGSGAALRYEMMKAPAAVLLAAASAAGLVVVSRPAWRGRPWRAWALCAAATFALLFAGVWGVLPGYARRFSYRGSVRPFAAGSLPVVSYPRRWDSISFYLRREVKVYTAPERARLVADLQEQGDTLVFVKTGAPLEALLADLPAGMEFVPQGRQGGLTVGRVRHRPELPLGLYADADH